MSVWSLCEHHMLPMNLQVTAGYVPDGEVVGLSKFGRIAQHVAGRLQVQERFTRQVAEHLASVIGREDVAVAVRGTHLCMSMAAGTALFGPVLRQAPRGDAAGQLWDGLVMVAATDGFFELKRSRDSKPSFE
jgi:hypothetical protein